jgi:acetyl esterase
VEGMMEQGTDMPLDPQARVYLDKLASLDLPGFHTMPPAEARKLFRTMRGLAGRPDPVDAVEDRITPGSIPLRLYRPLGPSRPPGSPAGPPSPVLVFFHGGGWVLGDIETVDNLCRRLANASGCAVVSVDYRLAPEAKFPGPLDDCFEAVEFIAREAESFGIDPRRIAVGGDSAGGNLAAAVTLRARGRAELAIAFQLLIYPITDFRFDTPSYSENSEGYGLSRDMMAWYWDQYLARPEDGESPFASPSRADDLAGLPPAFVITAGFDVLRDEGRAYADRLSEAGVPIELAHYPGMIHGFLQMADSFDQGKLAIAEAGRALRSALGAQAGPAR